MDSQELPGFVHFPCCCKFFRCPSNFVLVHFWCTCTLPSAQAFEQVIQVARPLQLTASKSLVSQLYTTLYTGVYNRIYKSGNEESPALHTNGHEQVRQTGVRVWGTPSLQTCTLAGSPPENVMCYACTLLCTLLYT